MSSANIQVSFEADQTLASFLSRHRFPAVHWWLVAALDSCHEPATTNPGKRWVSLGAAPVPGGGILLPTPMFDSALEEPSVFCGFDEVWGFAQPRTELGNCPVSIASDQGPVRLIDGLVDWLRRERPEVGLGDGIGTNVVTFK